MGVVARLAAAGATADARSLGAGSGVMRGRWKGEEKRSVVDKGEGCSIVLGFGVRPVSAGVEGVGGMGAAWSGKEQERS